MKIFRDKDGHITQINMDNGEDIPENEIKNVLDFISNDEKELAANHIREQEEKSKKFYIGMNVIPAIVENICSGVNEYMNYEKKVIHEIKTDDEKASPETKEEVVKGTRPEGVHFSVLHA